LVPATAKAAPDSIPDDPDAIDERHLSLTATICISLSRRFAKRFHPVVRDGGDRSQMLLFAKAGSNLGAQNFPSLWRCWTLNYGQPKSCKARDDWNVTTGSSRFQLHETHATEAGVGASHDHKDPYRGAIVGNRDTTK
jgi:hypothetical protein